jgi:hypothetical protein
MRDIDSKQTYSIASGRATQTYVKAREGEAGGQQSGIFFLTKRNGIRLPKPPAPNELYCSPDRNRLVAIVQVAELLFRLKAIRRGRARERELLATLYYCGKASNIGERK